MIRLAMALAAVLVAAPELASAQNKSDDSPTAASRFGISIDGLQKPKAKRLKATSSKKRKGGEVPTYSLRQAWPKK